MRSSSSPAVRGGVVGVAVAAGSGPGVVCPVFLFILLFFSSFFSSTSLERKRGNEVREKVRQEVKIFVQEHS
jgi:Na+-driven multidrug efflux pump